MAFLSLVSAVAAPFQAPTRLSRTKQTTVKPPETLLRDLTPKEILQRESPAIVAIHNVDPQGKLRATATGFIVKAEGTIVTNFHVIEGAYDAVMKLKSTEEFDRAMVIDYDQKRDLVVLSYRAARLPTVTLGDSEKAEPGDKVLAIGNPMGLEFTISDGLLSAKRIEGGTQLFQISAPISPGSSGGPLYNARGEVIGVTTAQVAAERAQNLNFAVPLKYALLLLEGPPRMNPTPIDQFTRQFKPPAREEPRPQLETYTDPSGTATITLASGWTAKPGTEGVLMMVSKGNSYLAVSHVEGMASVDAVFRASYDSARKNFKNVKPWSKLADQAIDGQPYRVQVFSARVEKQNALVLIGATMTAKGALVCIGLTSEEGEEDIKVMALMFYTMK